MHTYLKTIENPHGKLEKRVKKRELKIIQTDLESEDEMQQQNQIAPPTRSRKGKVTIKTSAKCENL